MKPTPPWVLPLHPPPAAAFFLLQSTHMHAFFFLHLECNWCAPLSKKTLLFHGPCICRLLLQCTHMHAFFVLLLECATGAHPIQQDLTLPWVPPLHLPPAAAVHSHPGSPYPPPPPLPVAVSNTNTSPPWLPAARYLPSGVLPNPQRAPWAPPRALQPGTFQLDVLLPVSIG